MKGKQPVKSLKEKGKINLVLGAVYPPIANQLIEQEYEFDKKEIAYCQKLLDSMIHLRIGLGMPDAPYYALQKKLVARVFKHVRSKNKNHG